MRKTRFIFIPTLWVILSFFGCRGNPDQEAGIRPPRTIDGVETAVARIPEIDILFSAPGTVRAVTQSTLTSKVMGNVTRVMVKEGDRVKKGDPLLKIESKDISAKIRQAQGALESAEAALRNAEANFKRISALFSRGSATRFELDGATLQLDSTKGGVKQARGAVKEAQTMKQYALIRAPAAGLITRKQVEVGDQAAPGRPLLEFMDPSRLQFETFVPESKLSSLRIGRKVEVIIDALGDERIAGIIAEMEPSSDPVSHSTKIKIDLKDARGALPGMYGKALILTGKRHAVLIPQKAVVKRGQLTAVYLLDKAQTFHFRLIQTGKSFRDQIEVLSGLTGGERIAVSKLDQLEDGTEVRE